MNRRELQEALRELHAELDRTPSIDEESRRLLTEIRNEIEELLARPRQEATLSPKSLDEQLKASLIHFEGTHPGLTVALNRVVDALANMGI
jgi:hypothetical protein